LSLKEAMAKIQATAGQAEAQFEQSRIQFEQQQKAESEAHKAKAMAEFTRRTQAAATLQVRQLEAIQKEAAKLYERSKRASPAEQAQIEQRALQLLEQLSQMGEQTPGAR
jgi:DMSO/TMAO reductase YedYZ molybdopterin-dependent catalytic subunit